MQGSSLGRPQSTAAIAYQILENSQCTSLPHSDQVYMFAEFVFHMDIEIFHSFHIPHMNIKFI